MLAACLSFAELKANYHYKIPRIGYFSATSSARRRVSQCARFVMKLFFRNGFICSGSYLPAGALSNANEFLFFSIVIYEHRDTASSGYSEDRTKAGIRKFSLCRSDLTCVCDSSSFIMVDLHSASTFCSYYYSLLSFGRLESHLPAHRHPLIPLRRQKTHENHNNNTVYASIIRGRRTYYLLSRGIVGTIAL